MRVCFWCSTFTADIWAFAQHLDKDPAYEVAIALHDPGQYGREAVFRLLPLAARLHQQADPATQRALASFAADVLVVDNHLPSYRVAPRLLVLWHGFGWKGPNDRKELASLHRAIRAQVGAGTRPNPRFVWQCFGRWDFEHRTRVSGFAPENCRVLGSAFSDRLLGTEVDRADVAGDYPGLDLVGRPTVLLAPTWHYGRIFGHWGDDAVVLGELFADLERAGVNVVFRLHDRRRYDEAYAVAIEALAARHARVLLKWKDRHEDNFVDLKVCDAVVSNYSSILNHAYVLGKPTVHVYPVESADAPFDWRILSRGKVRQRRVRSARLVWKLPLEENGGLVVRSQGELKDAIRAVLDDPSCCASKSAAFVEKYIERVDGSTCLRIESELRRLLER
jgi:hypothetical protein